MWEWLWGVDVLVLDAASLYLGVGEPCSLAYAGVAIPFLVFRANIWSINTTTLYLVWNVMQIPADSIGPVTETMGQLWGG